MKIFGWMQSKLNAKQVTKKTNTVAAANNNHLPQPIPKEEFSDWPQALLAIGTFGISNLKADPGSENHPQTTTPEAVGELQEELNSFLESVEESETQEPICEDLLRRDIHLQNDIFIDHKNNIIRKKSLTFILKKIFASRSSRLNHASLARDPLPDSMMDKSRMEKVLRAILNKKIHPQSSTSKAMPNKYLRRNETSTDDGDDKMSEAENEGSTWVKTDSEYIVLEI